jgi:hypothetical protein
MLKIDPTAGFVVKTCYENGEIEKAFINVCHSALVPGPLLRDKQAIRRAINAQDGTFKVPLSLLGPRADYDKSGNICHVYECCINSEYFEFCLQDDEFKLFITEMCLEWIETKHSIELSREQVAFPRMVSKGKLSTHTIAKRPVINELSAQEIKSMQSKPAFHVVCEPIEDPEYLVIQIELPLIVLVIIRALLLDIHWI